MSDNTKVSPWKTIGVMATAIAAVAGALMGILAQMEASKQNDTNDKTGKIQESTFNILNTRISDMDRRIVQIEGHIFKLTLTFSTNHECSIDADCPDAHACEDNMCVIEIMKPAPITPFIDPKPDPSPPTKKAFELRKFDDFQQVQQYVAEEGEAWREKK